MTAGPFTDSLGEARAVPALFVAHRAPEQAPGRPLVPERLGARLASSRAVVVLSAEWAVMGAVRVTVGSRPPTLRDETALAQGRYPARGHPALAREVAERLSEEGIFAELDRHRGWDRGTWGPLRHLFPEAQLPVVQVSLSLGARPADVARMGVALAPLRAEGVLLMGSAGPARTLRPVESPPWGDAFEAWLSERLRLRDFRGPQACSDAPYARMAHPSADHDLPLFFVLGSALPGDGVTPFFEGSRTSTTSSRSFALH